MPGLCPAVIPPQAVPRGPACCHQDRRTSQHPWAGAAGRRYRPVMDLDIATSTAAELTQAIRARGVSSRELLDQLVARASRLNPLLNAIVAWDLDRAGGRGQRPTTATGGEAPAPLHGLPMTVKDVFETEGLVTTSGAPELAGLRAAADAIAVARLRPAGAIIFGKTNTPLYAGDWQTYNDVYGRTEQPLGHQPDGGRVVWRCCRRRRGGAHAAGARQRHRRLDPQPVALQRRVRSQAVLGRRADPRPYPRPARQPGRGRHRRAPARSPATSTTCGRCSASSRARCRRTPGLAPRTRRRARRDGVSELRIAMVFGEGTDVLPVAAAVRANLEGFAARLAEAGAKVERDPAAGLAGRRISDLARPLAADHRASDCRSRVRGARPAGGRAGRRPRPGRRPGHDEPVPDLDDRDRAAPAAACGCGRASSSGYDVVLAPVMPTAAFPHDTDRPMAERLLDVDGVAVPHFVAVAWCCAIGSVLLPVVTLPVGRAPGRPAGRRPGRSARSSPTCGCCGSPSSSTPRPGQGLLPRRPWLLDL